MIHLDEFSLKHWNNGPKYTNGWQETSTIANAEAHELLIQEIGMHVNTESLVFIFLLLCTLPSHPPVPLQYSLYPITAAFLVWSSSSCNTMETGRKYYLTSHSSHLPLFITSLPLRQRMCFFVIFLKSRFFPVCECLGCAALECQISIFIWQDQKLSATLICTKYASNTYLLALTARCWVSPVKLCGPTFTSATVILTNFNLEQRARTHARTQRKAPQRLMIQFGYGLMG